MVISHIFMVVSIGIILAITMPPTPSNMRVELGISIIILAVAKWFEWYSFYDNFLVLMITKSLIYLFYYIPKWKNDIE